MGALANALLCLFTYFFTLGAYAQSKKRKDDGERPKVGMPRHSFANPMMYQSLLDDWVVSGASIFERERLLMHPAVSDRVGILWHKHQVKTKDFEIRMQFRVSGEQSPTKFATDQGIAVWYIQENMTDIFKEQDMIKAKSWSEGLKSAGFSFVGGPSKFQGFATVLSMADNTKKQRPVVSFVSNDNTKSLTYDTDAPTAAAKAVDFRNTLNPAELKIRVTPEYVEGHFKQSPSLSWNECFRIDRADGKTPIPENGFVGMTAWSGTPQEGAASDLVSIISVEMTNFDDTSVGEDVKDVSTKIQEAYREMLMDENRHFIDQKSQMEHLQRLTDMITDHVSEAVPADKRLFADLQSLDVRMGRLDEDCRTLSKEVGVLINPAGVSGAGAVKDEIIGLRRLLIQDSNVHKQKIDEVSKTVVAVKDVSSKASGETLSAVATQSEALEKTVVARSSQMSWLLFCLVACVILIGALMYNRMQYYEKKHQKIMNISIKTPKALL
jgi:hypothetical protein